MKQIIINVILAAVAALAPIHSVLITVCVLITADMITGMLASHKRGEKITSAEMRRTVSKFLVYQLTVISGFLVETYMIQGLLPVTKIVASVIGMVEFKSVLENTNTIVGKDILKEILAKLGSKNERP